MSEAGITLKRLYEQLESLAKDRRVADVRIGLSYIGVRLDDDTTGIAAVLSDTLPHGCMVMSRAGSFAGSPVAKMLRFLVEGNNSLEIALGLACANALIKPPPSDAIDGREATTYLDLQPGEKVAMVGLFSPLMERIRATGAVLTVIEKNPRRLEVISPENKRKALQDCDVAIITATTLLNNTFEETTSLLGKPRSVALMGPSTPLVPEIFLDTPVTHLGGAVVADSARVLQIISEGGGTPALRPYLHFVNLFLK
jgi:uncharacterized protein (DUF4213/DUF364 family)